MTCVIDGCQNARKYRQGWCGRHYMRWRKTGDPTTTRAWRPCKDEMVSLDGPCLVDGCPDPRESKGYCQRHYYRLRKYGNTAAGRATRPAPNGAGTTFNGYHFTTVWVDGKQRQIGTHRLVMERLIGRPLLPGESVHHRNGVKTDNRPENLELWISSQPSGQRVEDVVAWAREILARYGGLVTTTDIDAIADGLLADAVIG